MMTIHRSKSLEIGLFCALFTLISAGGCTTRGAGDDGLVIYEPSTSPSQAENSGGSTGDAAQEDTGGSQPGTSGGNPSTGGSSGTTTTGGMTNGGSSGGVASGGTRGTSTGGTGGTGGSTGGSTGGTNTAPTLTFDVLTKPVGGQYQPRNIGAIWISDEAGKWVKTLGVWASRRRSYLTRFMAASSGNSVDATTSATLSSHTTHHVTWNFKNAAGATVPDGRYTLQVELTDKNGPGDTTSVSFTKSSTPSALKPPDTAHFINMNLTIQ